MKIEADVNKEDLFECPKCKEIAAYVACDYTDDHDDVETFNICTFCGHDWYVIGDIRNQ